MAHHIGGTPEGDLVYQFTEEEAQTLRDILRRVGGDPEESRRKVSKRVLSVLYDSVGVGPKAPDLVGNLVFNSPTY